MVHTKCIFKKLIIFVLALTTVFLVGKHMNQLESSLFNRRIEGNIEVKNASVEDRPNEESPVFIIIVCNDDENILTSSFKRQIDQVSVLLKSAAALTLETLRFLVVTNSEVVFEQVKLIPLAWPDKFRARIKLEPRSVWYPSDREDMKRLLRPCSSARLFLPETMSDIETAVLIDTDTIFLKPPEDLLMEVYKFNESQAVGLAQTSRDYRDRNIPFPKPRGVNTGVMIMNMTRLRALPGGWTTMTMRAFDKYKNELSTTVTNDIINIALAQNLEILYDLDCIWNYSTGACITGSNSCPEAETTGVYLIHGANAAFFDNAKQKFKIVFEAWQNFQLGTSLKDLLKDFKEKLYADLTLPVNCNKKYLRNMFTTSLKIMLGY